MLGQEKLSRHEVLKELNISDDILLLYEHELEMETDPKSGGLENFTKEDFQSLRMFHKLRESGLTYNEIKLLGSFSEVLSKTDMEGKSDDIKNLLKLSPVHRLKQSLSLSRQELGVLRTKIQELEEALRKELENRELYDKEKISSLEAEVELKQKSITNLDRQLSEVLTQKSRLEAEVSLLKESKAVGVQVKGKRTKELYKLIEEKENEINDLKKKSEELKNEAEKHKVEVSELTERLELIEDGISEMEHEVEERYHDQIEGLKSQIETLVEKKQKEWESYYIQSNEQHRKELLTLQKKHEQEVLRLKRKLKEQMEVIYELRTNKNPLLGLIKIGEMIKDRYRA